MISAGVVAEVGKLEVAGQGSAVGVRVGAHALQAAGREVGELLAQRAVLVEQLLGSIGPHPRLELREMLGAGGEL